MDRNADPSVWTLREWLAFMLLAAASADGKREQVEMRYLHVELGAETVGRMEQLLDGMDLAQQEALIRESLPLFLQKRGSREKLQLLLRDIFLADGVYEAGEQAMTRRISDWIRASS